MHYVVLMFIVYYYYLYCFTEGYCEFEMGCAAVYRTIFLSVRVYVYVCVYIYITHT